MPGGCGASAVTIATVLLLAACSGGSSAGTSAGTAVAASVPTPTPSPTPTPTPFPTPTPTAGNVTWTEGDLVFQSGFGGTTAIVPATNGNERVVGRDDSVAKSDFSADLAAFGGTSAQALIDYTGGDASKRQGVIAADPINPANKTLRFVLREPYAASEGETKGRVQLDFYSLTPGIREFRQSVRGYLSADFRKLESYPSKITWLTLAEYWNNEWFVAGEPYGFRITVGIGKPSSATQPLNLFVEAQDVGQIEIWRRDDPTATIPIGQWFTLETYFREGDRGTGRFVLAITPDGGTRRVLYDVRDFTQNTHDPAPNGLTGYNPVKLYTSAGVVDHVRKNGGALQTDWADLKIWKIR